MHGNNSAICPALTPSLCITLRRAGLYAIGMLLCIQFTDAFLSASDVSVSLGLSPLATRQRGTTAGALMSALFNALVILCLGTVCTETAEIGDKAEVRAELI